MSSLSTGSLGDLAFRSLVGVVVKEVELRYTRIRKPCCFTIYPEYGN